MELELDVCEVAEKQRHLSLLKKVKENKPLTPGELDELGKYESKSKKGKNKDSAKDEVYFDTQVQAAAYAKVDSRTIRRWVKDEKIVKQNHKGKKVYAQKDIDNLLKEERSEEVVKSKNRLLKAETNFKEIRAARAKHELELQLKNYIHISVVRQQQIGRITVIKKALLSVGRKLGPMVRGKKTSKKITAIINEEMKNIIRDFADGFDGTQGKGLD